MSIVFFFKMKLDASISLPLPSTIDNLLFLDDTSFFIFAAPVKVLALLLFSGLGYFTLFEKFNIYEYTYVYPL